MFKRVFSCALFAMLLIGMLAFMFEVRLQSEILWETNFENTDYLNFYDIAGCRGGGSHTRSGAFVSTAVGGVGGSASSMRLYQIDGTTTPKDDAQRRVGLYKFATWREYYKSWWCYFDTSMLNVTVWQGISTEHQHYGPSDTDREKYSTTLQLALIGSSSATRQFELSYSHVYETTTAYKQLGVYLKNLVNRWIHFETHYKLGVGDGVEELWIDGVQYLNLTGVTNDPMLADPARWSSEGLKYWVDWDTGTASGTYPFEVSIKTYSGITTPEHWYYVDNVVYSKKYIP